MDEPTTDAGIPRHLAPCFQEYELEQLDPEAHSDLIIERTLAYGDRRAAHWLWQRYGQARLGATPGCPPPPLAALHALVCSPGSATRRSSAQRSATDMEALSPVHWKAITPELRKIL